MLGWREATQRALYGERGFYRAGPGPAAHFRTSVHASGLFAAAVARLAGLAGVRTVVDVGAGRGELLRALHAAEAGLVLHGVEVAARPEDLPEAVGWSERVPAGLTDALLVANEWLDNIPVEVVERHADGVRLVLVDPASGEEAPGGPPPAADADWLARWWPLQDAEPGQRAEVGRGRDEAWASVVGCLRRGLAVAVDYGHGRQARPPFGSLAGYRGGRVVRPLPDGSCDVTAHVALDACAAAGEAGGATATLLTTQRAALHALGVSGTRPPLGLATTDPASYLRALAAATEAAELTAAGGLGDFGWLVQAVGIPLPAALRACPGWMPTARA